MRRRGPWARGEIDAFLTSARIPLRLAVSGRSGGAPFVVSLWYLWRDGAFWCATPEKSAVVAALRRNAACGFEVAGDTPPYHGVRGQGQAHLTGDGDALLRELYARYGGRPEHPFADWLLNREEPEAIIRIVPDRMTSWDFRERMGDAFDPGQAG